jgi:hypothetical protein
MLNIIEGITDEMKRVIFFCAHGLSVKSLVFFINDRQNDIPEITDECFSDGYFSSVILSVK